MDGCVIEEKYNLMYGTYHGFTSRHFFCRTNIPFHLAIQGVYTSHMCEAHNVMLQVKVKMS
jgi:hypothetical protein